MQTKAFSRTFIKKNQKINDKNIKWLRCSRKGINKLSKIINLKTMAKKNIEPNKLLTLKDIIY